jgi:hypothetical protein
VRALVLTVCDCDHQRAQCAPSALLTRIMDVGTAAQGRAHADEYVRPRYGAAASVHDVFMETSAYFLAVRTVVNREDPVGLMHLGAPEDEYDPRSQI